MNKQNIIISAIIAVVAAFIIIAPAVSKNSGTKLGSADYNLLNQFTSSSVLASSTASTLLVATSSGRLYLSISNNDTVSPQYLGFGAPAVKNKGVRIAPGGSYEIDQRNMYFGAIFVTTASSTAATTTYAEGTRY